MKNNSQLLAVLMMFAFSAKAQQFTETTTKELIFEKAGNNTLMIFNINGPVRIIGTTGDKVVVEAERTIQAKTDRRLEIGKQDLKMGIEDRADSIMLFIEGTCNKFGKSKYSRRHGRDHQTNGWGYVSEDWNNRNSCREEFDYQVKFTVKVPRGINVYVSTINDGDVTVENVSGKVFANNINGSITLKDISGQTNASTINGSVDLNYTSNPPAECRYYSLNGDINASFRKGLTAELSFESFNGDLYTNMEMLEAMPVLALKIPTEEGIKYKVSGNHFKIGKGGVMLDFETFNGNVYLKESVN